MLWCFEDDVDLGLGGVETSTAAQIILRRSRGTPQQCVVYTIGTIAIICKGIRGTQDHFG